MTEGAGAAQVVPARPYPGPEVTDMARFEVRLVKTLAVASVQYVDAEDEEGARREAEALIAGDDVLSEDHTEQVTPWSVDSVEPASEPEGPGKWEELAARAAKVSATSLQVLVHGRDGLVIDIGEFRLSEHGDMLAASVGEFVDSFDRRDRVEAVALLETGRKCGPDLIQETLFRRTFTRR